MPVLKDLLSVGKLLIKNVKKSAATDQDACRRRFKLRGYHLDLGIVARAGAAKDSFLRFIGMGPKTPIEDQFTPVVPDDAR